ncbi:MAG: hypothetical protein FWD68_14685 [Alphaproteobacteria bacterium]|nr:hypothetical protein [Alphaproteobacteria bacterium]
MQTQILKWRFPEEVEIDAKDIVWFRKCRSSWFEIESGAPWIEPVEFRDGKFAKAVLSQLERVLCAFFLHASFTSGRYPLNQSPDGRTTFAVTDDHIRLLRSATWKTSGIDGKRPYGGSTDYAVDMADILGLSLAPGRDRPGTVAGTDVRARMEALHKEMLFAVQAYVEHADLSPGVYVVPYQGWDGIIRPRCCPPTAARIAAYQQSMAEIAERSRLEAPANLVIAQILAADALFSVSP